MLELPEGKIIVEVLTHEQRRVLEAAHVATQAAYEAADAGGPT